jgi:hypothetical protein
MSAYRSAFVPAVVVGLGFLSFACGGNGSVSGPDTPSTRGASIQGTVVTSSAAGIQVSVVGTSVATMTDAAGRFGLADVPAGSPTLRFQAAGIDAQLGVQVSAGQTLEIRVAVAGSQATLISPSASPNPGPTPSPSPGLGSEMEFRGTIQGINGTDLTVAGRLVHTDGNTRIRRSGNNIPFSALAVGRTVEVEGVGQPDGSVFARKISLEDDGDDDDDDDKGGAQVEFKGTIQSISGGDLKVSGRLVHTNGATQVKRKGDAVPFSALAAGQRVEVEGTQQSDGSVLAKKIGIED